jgi:hypothetical protein
MSATKASLDMRKLDKSIRKYATKFGDSTAQATVRWAVSTARELAKYSQPFGSSRKANLGAIRKDALSSVILEDGKTPKGKMALKTPEEMIAWMDRNRINKGKRIPKMDIRLRRRASLRVFNKAVSIKMQRAGMAKGAWIGAGNRIAAAQKGSGRVTIGSNFMKYAQKHAGLGSAKRPIPGFKPFSQITNSTRYSSDPYVLRKSQIQSALNDGKRKTLNWYRYALRLIDKQKP